MDNIITLDYGSGGQKTAELIEELIVPAFRNRELEQLGDGAVLDIFKETVSGCCDGKQDTYMHQSSASGKLVFSTDSFVVSPYFFPGGDIGKLAVCGTVNDIAVSGGIPKYLSLSAIIEEGLPFDDLKKIIESIRETAGMTGVRIVTGDTKVVEKGKGDGIYLNTSGIGLQVHDNLSPANIRKGDKIIVSGPVGNHGVAVMLARNPGFMQHEIRSDCAPVCAISEALFPLGNELRVMRDPTRGGVATTLCEFADQMSSAKEAERLCIELEETSVPVDEDVKAACDILGLDPLYCACEGRLIAAVSPESAEEAVKRLQSVPGGEKAAVIGTVTDRYPGRVVLNTPIGGTRVLSKLSGSQLPRIC